MSSGTLEELEELARKHRLQKLKKEVTKEALWLFDNGPAFNFFYFGWILFTIAGLAGVFSMSSFDNLNFWSLMGITIVLIAVLFLFGIFCSKFFGCFCWLGLVRWRNRWKFRLVPPREEVILEYLNDRILEAENGFRADGSIEGKLQEIGNRLQTIKGLITRLKAPYGSRRRPSHVNELINRAKEEIQKLEAMRSHLESGRATMNAFFQECRAQLSPFQGRLREIAVIEQLNEELRQSEETLESARLALVESVNGIFSKYDSLRAEMNTYLDSAIVQLALSAGNTGDLQADLLTIESTLEAQITRR